MMEFGGQCATEDGGSLKQLWHADNWDIPDQVWNDVHNQFHECPVKFLVSTVGATVRSSSLVGQGTGVIFLSDLRCIGTENRLFACPNSGLEVNTCTHSSDAGVLCVPGEQIEFHS